MGGRLSLNRENHQRYFLSPSKKRVIDLGTSKGLLVQIKCINKGIVSGTHNRPPSFFA